MSISIQHVQKEMLAHLEKMHAELDQFFNARYVLWLASNSVSIRELFQRKLAIKLERIHQLLYLINITKLFINHKITANKLFYLLSDLKNETEYSTPDSANDKLLTLLIKYLITEKIEHMQYQLTILSQQLHRLHELRVSYLTYMSDLIKKMTSELTQSMANENAIYQLDFPVTQALTSERSMTHDISLPIHMNMIENQFLLIVISHMIDGILDLNELKRVSKPALKEIVREEMHKSLMQHYPGLSQSTFDAYLASMEQVFANKAADSRILKQIDVLFSESNKLLIAKSKYCFLKTNIIENGIDQLTQTLRKAKNNLALLQAKDQFMTESKAYLFADITAFFDDPHIIDLKPMLLELEKERVSDNNVVNTLLNRNAPVELAAISSPKHPTSAKHSLDQEHDAPENNHRPYLK